MLGDRYPQKIRVNVSGLGGDLLFEVRSDVERYRVKEFGGEAEFLTRFLEHLREDDIVYDVGASVGVVTVLASTALDDGRVVAFEPDPETRSRLERNLELNEISNAEVVSWAASEMEGSTDLFTDGASGFAPSLRRQSRDGAPTGNVEVETKRIDRAVEGGEIPAPSVLKVDVEGAEGLCLRGAQRTLGGEFGRAPRLLFLELHPAFLPDFGDSLKDLQEMVVRLGFDESWRLTRENEIHVCYRTRDPDGS